MELPKDSIELARVEAIVACHCALPARERTAMVGGSLPPYEPDRSCRGR